MNTMQNEFDAVVTHLFTQGRPAKGDDTNGPGCFYRKDGLSCAVGCRIPDAVYDPRMDSAETSYGTSVRSLIIRFRGTIPAEIAAYEYMFEGLQYAHDQCDQFPDGAFDFNDLAERLGMVAKAAGLTFTRPEGK